MPTHTPPDGIVSRRDFLRAAVAVPLAGAISRPERPASRYTVLLLGDVHFDRLAHHDMDWLRREKPNDIQQVENYTQLTRVVWPKTLARLRARTAPARSNARGFPLQPEGSGDPAAAPVAFVAQLGDLIEGLCGSPALAERQAQEALASIREAQLGAPFLFCKGNHDITGPGAKETFDRLLLPSVRSGIDRLGSSAKCFDSDGSNLVVEYAQDWFLFLDAYDPRSLAWIERVLARRTARHVFLLVHPPVVPYGARATWVLYGRPGEGNERQRFLNLLGEHRVFALTGHIHKYAAITRRTDRGPFVQLALCSVIPSGKVAAACQLTGIGTYTPDQVRVEPAFSPENESDRRAVLAAEAPYIRAFEYGDVPGHASIAIDGPNVRVELYAGLTTGPWRTLDLVRLRDAVQ